MEERLITKATAKKMEQPSIQPHLHPYDRIPNTNEMMPAAIISLMNSSSKFFTIFVRHSLRIPKEYDAFLFGDD